MTPNQYRKAIEELNLSQVGAAKFFGISDRTCRYWAKKNGKAKIPKAVSMLLTLMIKLGIKPEDL